MMIHIIVCLFMFVFAVSAGNPVKDAQVYIETVKNSEQIAFRKTGDSGSLTFNELDKGRYNIVVVFPAQKGKLAHGRKKMNLNLIFI